MTNQAGSAFGNATAYERYVGRWSRVVATQFLDWIDVAPGSMWLDVGAGTGVLTQAILDHAAPEKIVGIDPSPEYVERARERISDERVTFEIGDATTMTFDALEFDAAVAGLVLNFVPSPLEAAKRMRDAVRADGTIAAYVWDYGERMQMMRHFWDAAMAVDPAAKDFHSAAPIALSNPDTLRDLFESAQVRAIEVVPIDIETKFADFEDYWTPFLAAQGSLSKYLNSIDDAMRQIIREQLLRQLPIQSDGSIPLTARAWAVKGKR